MAAPGYIGSVSSGLANADGVTLDVSALAFESGDLAIAAVSFGDTDGSGGVPAGWLRVTGAVIAEDVALQGELLFRYLASGDGEFTFTAADTGAIAASISVYRGVDTLRVIDAQAETVETGGGTTTHDAPGVTTTLDNARLVSVYFLWYSNSGGTVAGGQTERVDLSVVAGAAAPDRDVAILIGDEAFVTAGATGVRQASTAESGLANCITLALTENIETRTAWDREYGTEQGRIAPAGAIPVDTYSFVLGADIASEEFDLAAGDFVEVKQAADFDTVNLVGVTVRMRGAAAMPVGLRWKFSMRIDGGERAGQLLTEGRTRDATFAANVSQLAAGDHELAFRLELVAV